MNNSVNENPQEINFTYPCQVHKHYQILRILIYRICRQIRTSLVESSDSADFFVIINVNTDSVFEEHFQLYNRYYLANFAHYSQSPKVNAIHSLMLN